MRTRWVLNCLLVTFLAPTPYGRAQSSSLDLRKLPSATLQACYEDLKNCGAKSIYEISDEFTRRLPNLSTEQLLECFDNWKICGAAEDRASGWPISDELARRGNITPILNRFWVEPKWTIRDGIEHVAYHFNTLEATAFMQKAFTAKKKDGDDLYWPTNYLAKHCDPDALKELSTGRYRNQGCIQYQTSVALFGKCRYRPAVPYLIDAVNDICLNVTDAAETDLRTLFPRSPKEFGSIEEMQKYFCKRAQNENFSVHCAAK